MSHQKPQQGKKTQIGPTLVSIAWRQWSRDLQKCTIICRILLWDQKQSVVRNRWRWREVFCFCVMNTETPRLIIVHSICSILSFADAILQANEVNSTAPCPSSRFRSNFFFIHTALSTNLYWNVTCLEFYTIVQLLFIKFESRSYLMPWIDLLPWILLDHVSGLGGNLTVNSTGGDGCATGVGISFSSQISMFIVVPSKMFQHIQWTSSCVSRCYLLWRVRIIILAVWAGQQCSLTGSIFSIYVILLTFIEKWLLHIPGVLIHSMNFLVCKHVFSDTYNKQ